MTVQPPSTRSNPAWFLIILVVVLFITWLAFQSMKDETPLHTPVPTESDLPTATATLPAVDESQEPRSTAGAVTSPLPTVTSLPAPYPLVAPTEPAASYPLPTIPPLTPYPAPGSD